MLDMMTPAKGSYSPSVSRKCSPFTPRNALLSIRTATRKVSPKASILRGASPIKLDYATADWQLTGTGPQPTPRKSKKTTIRSGTSGDRFIPVRTGTATATSKLVMDTAQHATSYSANPSSLAYQSCVAEACGLALNTRILAFKQAAPESSKPIDLRSQYNRPLKPLAAAMRRKIVSTPDRVLDAPGLLDDYYLNLLDWSSSNSVAIGLERALYVWNADSGTVSQLMETSPDTYIAGVKWSADGAYVSVGLGDGDVHIWDIETGTRLRSMRGHAARVGVLSWDKHILSSGCRDGSIHNHDVRVADHKVSELLGHSSEVCGLEWRSDGAQLASGGNDNLVNIWDARSSAPKFSKTNHKAAVKALAWCPWQNNLLVSGGGSYDRHMHFWNSTSGARVNSIDTGSQVTSIRWSHTYKELVSSHGFPDNHLAVWSYPTLVKNTEIPAHETRVLHSALSPDGQTLATAASDENLKFWKLFEQTGRKPSVSAGGVHGKEVSKAMTIR